jgi:hypothetical protein
MDISELESALSALEKTITVLEKSSESLEKFWLPLFTILVVIGVAIKAWIVIREYWGSTSKPPKIPGGQFPLVFRSNFP